jgi:threonine dehydratase
MKIIIEPSSALAVAAVLGETGIAGSAQTAWLDLIGKRIEYIQDQKHSPVNADESGYTVRVVVIISGGNVSFEKRLSGSRSNDYRIDLIDKTEGRPWFLA